MTQERKSVRASVYVCVRERWILFCVLLFEYSEHADQRADLRSRIILRITHSLCGKRRDYTDFRRPDAGKSTG